MAVKAAVKLADNLFGLVHREIDNYDPRYITQGFDEFDPTNLLGMNIGKNIVKGAAR